MKCIICGNIFEGHGLKKTCSVLCLKRHKANRQIGYHYKDQNNSANIRKRSYEKNKEKWLASAKEYRKENPFKLMLIGSKKKYGDYDEAAFIKRLELMNECVYCGSKDNLTLEHLISASKGGINIINNVYMACLSCNESKQEKEFLVWYRKHKNYSPRREFDILSKHLAG